MDGEERQGIGMKRFYKIVALLLSVVILFSRLNSSVAGVQAADSSNTTGKLMIKLSRANKAKILLGKKNIAKKTIRMEKGSKLSFSKSKNKKVKSVAYRSMNKKCITVSPKGKITAKNTGTAKIKIAVKMKRGKTVSSWIKIKVIKEKSAKDKDTKEDGDAPKLLYQGQASIRIVTPECKVIYIDPYAGDTYHLSADLILVTHGHYDHSDVDKVKKRRKDCRIITHKEALKDGKHQAFDLGYVKAEAVETGYNEWHDVKECVGYVLTFTNGKSVYVTGDTSTTKQMPRMAQMKIDYAFYCCDGVFNMGLKEAAKCAKLVGAKHNIPYHTSANTSGPTYDRKRAEKFDAPDRLLVDEGEEIAIK